MLMATSLRSVSSWVARFLAAVILLLAFGSGTPAERPIASAQISRRGWPTKAHDTRRTSQSPVNGPASPALVARRAITNATGINIAAVVGEDHTAYFGTWGAIAGHGQEDRSRWDKFDGQFYAWLSAFSLEPRFFERWGPGTMDHVPFCYDFKTGWDFIHCPNPVNSDLSWWNGTVEGTATLSADQRTIYVGRGDGKVYALDTATGARRWTFRTCNTTSDCNQPTTHPEAGGEVIAGLLLRGENELYIATYGVPESGYESNAFYRLDARNGDLVWRYPVSGTLPAAGVAAPALSPDGNTIYFATWGEPGSLYAFAPNGTLRWSPVELRGEGGAGSPAIGAWTLAVGSEGTIYVGGRMGNACDSAVVLAYRPDGTRRWGPVQLPAKPLTLPCANITGGLALREVNGQTTRVYATTNFIAGLSAVGTPDGGRLFALDPATGQQPWGSPFFEPSAPPVKGFGNAVYPAIGADGTVYFGVSGALKAALPVYRVETPGRILAVAENGALRWQYTVAGLLTWSHPVIGPDGTLYLGEMKDRPVDPLGRPIEDPIFRNYDFSPNFYALRDQGPRVRFLPLLRRG